MKPIRETQMKRSNHFARTCPGYTRRNALGLLGGTALLGTASRPAFAQRMDDVLNEAQVLRDPDVPATGNPDGDVNIVEWFDYNCPYCRKIAPEIQQVVQDDGKVRLVLKDWPILGEVSKFAARSRHSNDRCDRLPRSPPRSSRPYRGTGQVCTHNCTSLLARAKQLPYTWTDGDANTEFGSCLALYFRILSSPL